MPQIANQYSFVLTGIFLLALMAGLLAWRRKRLGAREAGVLLLLAALLAGVWFALRPKSAQSVTVEQIRAQFGQGKPVLLEFQSPY